MSWRLWFEDQYWRRGPKWQWRLCFSGYCHDLACSAFRPFMTCCLCAWRLMTCRSSLDYIFCGAPWVRSLDSWCENLKSDLQWLCLAMVLLMALLWELKIFAGWKPNILDQATMALVQCSFLKSHLLENFFFGLYATTVRCWPFWRGLFFSYVFNFRLCASLVSQIFFWSKGVLVIIFEKCNFKANNTMWHRKNCFSEYISKLTSFIFFKKIRGSPQFHFKRNETAQSHISSSLPT
jgi:hypothetical protein